jgi:hypothetical protein
MGYLQNCNTSAGLACWQVETPCARNGNNPLTKSSAGFTFIVVLKKERTHSISPRCERRFVDCTSSAVQLQRPLCAVMFELVTLTIA